MTSQRFAPVAAVALAAVLSAVFVAVAPVPMQGVGVDGGRAPANRHDTSSAALALGAGSLVDVAMPASRTVRPGGA